MSILLLLSALKVVSITEKTYLTIPCLLLSCNAIKSKTILEEKF